MSNFGMSTAAVGAVGFLPPITQIAYVVVDLDAAVTFWARHMRVGPFRILPHIQYVESEYRGAFAEFDLSLALAWRDGVEIELMQLHSKGPCIIDHAPACGGVHHVGIRTANIAEDERRLVAAGMRRLQRNVSATGTETMFFEGPLGLIELIGVPGGSPLAEKLRQAALVWDGVDPILP
ncbi:VOC family protein [Corticibacterium sp. UT-5YL-CI-8]|nr:VOC family protein [Tianweitania sp. UT-5YL-CI-8]